MRKIDYIIITLLYKW